MLVYEIKKKDEELFVNYIRFILRFTGPLIFIEGNKKLFILSPVFLSTDFFRYKRKNNKRGRARLKNIVLEEKAKRVTIGQYFYDYNISIEGNHRYFLVDNFDEEITILYSPRIDVQEVDLVFNIISRLPEIW